MSLTQSKRIVLSHRNNSVLSAEFFIKIMPRKVRELMSDLKRAGFYEIQGGKGSHRKFLHRHYSGAVTLSGKEGDDAKPYQEKQIKFAIEQSQK